MLFSHIFILERNFLRVWGSGGRKGKEEGGKEEREGEGGEGEKGEATKRIHSQTCKCSDVISP